MSLLCERMFVFAWRHDAPLAQQDLGMYTHTHTHTRTHTHDHRDEYRLHYYGEDSGNVPPTQGQYMQPAFGAATSSATSSTHHSTSSATHTTDRNPYMDPNASHPRAPRHTFPSAAGSHGYSLFPASGASNSGDPGSFVSSGPESAFPGGSDTWEGSEREFDQAVACVSHERGRDSTEFIGLGEGSDDDGDWSGAGSTRAANGGEYIDRRAFGAVESVLEDRGAGVSRVGDVDDDGTRAVCGGENVGNGGHGVLRGTSSSSGMMIRSGSLGVSVSLGASGSDNSSGLIHAPIQKLGAHDGKIDVLVDSIANMSLLPQHEGCSLSVLQGCNSSNNGCFDRGCVDVNNPDAGLVKPSMDACGMHNEGCVHGQNSLCACEKKGGGESVSGSEVVEKQHAVLGECEVAVYRTQPDVANAVRAQFSEDCLGVCVCVYVCVCVCIWMYVCVSVCM